MRVAITGSQGFILSYLVDELLNRGHFVLGIDNYSKYGPIEREHDKHPSFKFKNVSIGTSRRESRRLYKALAKFEADIVICGAALIGGIKFFHDIPFDILAQNNSIMGDTLYVVNKLKKKPKEIIYISSSMVFEATQKFPSKEYDNATCPPPLSSYGFQKLAGEYYVKSFFRQYGIPYTIIRPFNAVGVREEDFRQGKQSHCLPDLAVKVLQGQNPLKIYGDGSQLRCYTSGYDIARGIRMAIESKTKARNTTYNISTSRPTTVIELAQLVWKEVHGNTPIYFETEKPFTYDVQKRIPDVTKAKEELGFVAEISLEESVKEVVDHIKRHLCPSQ